MAQFVASGFSEAFSPKSLSCVCARLGLLGVEQDFRCASTVASALRSSAFNSSGLRARAISSLSLVRLPGCLARR